MLHICTCMSEPFSLPRLTWDTLTQISRYAQPALGSPRGCFMPRPAYEKLAMAPKSHPCAAHSRTHPLHREIGQGCHTHDLLLQEDLKQEWGKWLQRCPESIRRGTRVPHQLPSMTLQSSWRYQCRELLQFLLKTVFLASLVQQYDILPQ